MPHKYLLLLLSLAVVLVSCQKADAVAASAASLPTYGVAYTWPMDQTSWGLILCDGVVPNPGTAVLLGADGKARHFVDEPAVLNYLYSLGWDVLPNGTEAGNHRYMLKRRTP